MTAFGETSSIEKVPLFDIDGHPEIAQYVLAAPECPVLVKGSKTALLPYGRISQSWPVTTKPSTGSLAFACCTSRVIGPWAFCLSFPTVSVVLTRYCSCSDQTRAIHPQRAVDRLGGELYVLREFGKRRPLRGSYPQVVETVASDVANVISKLGEGYITVFWTRGEIGPVLSSESLRKANIRFEMLYEERQVCEIDVPVSLRGVATAARYLFNALRDVVITNREKLLVQRSALPTLFPGSGEVNFDFIVPPIYLPGRNCSANRKPSLGLGKLRVSSFTQIIRNSWFISKEERQKLKWRLLRSTNLAMEAALLKERLKRKGYIIKGIGCSNGSMFPNKYCCKTQVGTLIPHIPLIEFLDLKEASDEIKKCGQVTALADIPLTYAKTTFATFLRGVGETVNSIIALPGPKSAAMIDSMIYRGMTIIDPDMISSPPCHPEATSSSTGDASSDDPFEMLSASKPTRKRKPLFNTARPVLVVDASSAFKKKQSKPAAVVTSIKVADRTLEELRERALAFEKSALLQPTTIIREEA